MPKKQDEIDILLTRGVQDVVVKSELEKLLRSGKKLSVYLGVDPTSKRISLGNAVPLRKLRDFQRLGHKVIFLVGSFTARIGDTSDKETMRKPMAPDEIEENFKTYKKQAGKIIDFSKAKIVYNEKWLKKLSMSDVVELAQQFTVQQMIERDMYQKRLSEGKPIGLHEFLYPLMQGYDSVALEVDVEIGGNDQLFNMLAGRTLLKSYKDKDKHVVTTPLIEGLDGRKMSKSYNNTVDVADEPADMFGKIMSLHDDLIVKYLELCTDVPTGEIAEITEGLKNGENPRDAKARLAREVVALYHSDKDAHHAEDQFGSVFQDGNMPDDIEEGKVGGGTYRADDLVVDSGLIGSKSEAKRLIEQGAVKINGEAILEWGNEITVSSGDVIQVGKRKFVKIK